MSTNYDNKVAALSLAKELAVLSDEFFNDSE